MSRRGFVDIQVNGFMGRNFTSISVTADDVRDVTRDLLKRGTIAYCPTVVTGSMELYERNLPLIVNTMTEPEMAGSFLGLHLEGPFICMDPGARGAHEPQYIRKPSIDDFKRIYDWADGKVAILTVAAGESGIEELISYAAEQGVVVSLGHQSASEEAIAAAVAAGATCSTHVGNGIQNTIDRHRNSIWPQLACDELCCSFITDGHHLPPAVIKVALRAKGVDRFIVISDVSPLAGLPVGSYECFGKMLDVEPSGRIYSPESQGLGASGSTMIECMNHLASFSLLSEADLWKVGLENPLELLGKSVEQLKDVDGPEVRFDGVKFTII